MHFLQHLSKPVHIINMSVDCSSVSCLSEAGLRGDGLKADLSLTQYSASWPIDSHSQH